MTWWKSELSLTLLVLVVDAAIEGNSKRRSETFYTFMDYSLHPLSSSTKLERQCSSGTRENVGCRQLQSISLSMALDSDYLGIQSTSATSIASVSEATNLHQKS